MANGQKPQFEIWLKRVTWIVMLFFCLEQTGWGYPDLGYRRDLATLSSPSLLQHGNVYNLNKKTSTITATNRHLIIDQYIIEKLIVQLPHQNPLIVELGLGQAPAPTFLEWYDKLHKINPDKFRLIGIDNNSEVVRGVQEHIDANQLNTQAILGTFSTIAENFEGIVDMIRCFVVLHYYDKLERDAARAYFLKALCEGGVLIEGGFSEFIVYEKRQGILVPIEMGIVERYALPGRIGEIAPDIKGGEWLKHVRGILSGNPLEPLLDSLEEYDYVRDEKVIIFYLDNDGNPIRRSKETIQQEQKQIAEIYNAFSKELKACKNSSELDMLHKKIREHISAAYNDKIISERQKRNILRLIKFDISTTNTKINFKRQAEGLTTKYIGELNEEAEHQLVLSL